MGTLWDNSERFFICAVGSLDIGLITSHFL